jgi:hypothetical protein
MLCKYFVLSTYIAIEHKIPESSSRMIYYTDKRMKNINDYFTTTLQNRLASNKQKICGDNYGTKDDNDKHRLLST